MADEQDDGTTANSEGIFTMDPQAVVWGLARTLVRGQSDLVEMRRTADYARSVADQLPDEARRVAEQCQRLETSWYSETLPMIAASFKLALEVYDTFGPGMTRVEDATESAIWNNKHHVWVTVSAAGTRMGRDAATVVGCRKPVAAAGALFHNGRVRSANALLARRAITHSG